MGIESRRVREFEVDLTSFGRTSDSITIPAVLADLVSRRRAIVMYVGRIQSSKGALDLLDAFLRLPADAAAASTLVFVGDGVDMPVLRSRVAQLGSDSVLLLGAVPHGQLPAVMRMATLIATPTQPQLPEGRCMVALEAMVLGIPVVAPNFAAFPYAVRHGVNGLLFEAGSIPALAECLARVIGDPGLHSELSAGAAQSGRELIAGFTSFGAAVEAAFGA
ncbi:MAG: glycosyltransferase [Pirellulaceae bacterium]